MESASYFFLTRSRRVFLLATMVVVAAALVLLRWRTWTGREGARAEGFSQARPFVAKYEADCYDAFYADIYDAVHMPERQLAAVRAAVEATLPGADSAFLDVGCGTGAVAHMLDEMGLAVYGADRSEAMVRVCEEAHPRLKGRVKAVDCLEPMAYDKGALSHVLCTDKTIYQFADKVAFFRNCHLWLRPGGYLILHLVDRARFDPISPAGRPALIEAPQALASERITVTEVDFSEFRYRAAYDFAGRGGDGARVVLRETFVDAGSRCVRENEQTLYMEDVDAVLALARYAGFFPKGKMDMKAALGDEHQFLFVLERPM